MALTRSLSDHRIGQLVTVMLVTSLCWWLYDGDWFEMLVAESLCWWLFSLYWWFSLCIKSVTNISNLSPTHLVSNIRHQHRCNLANLITKMLVTVIVSDQIHHQHLKLVTNTACLQHQLPTFMWPFILDGWKNENTDRLFKTRFQNGTIKV